MVCLTLLCTSHNSIIASIDTVGDIMFYFSGYILWGRPSAYHHAFIVPSLFPLKNIRYQMFFFHHLTSLLLMWHEHSVCNVFSSLSIALSPLGP